MEIHDVHLTVSFEMINIGKCFRYKGTIYLKCANNPAANIKIPGAAVRFSDGMLCSFDNKCDVTPVKTRLYIMGEEA